MIALLLKSSKKKIKSPKATTFSRKSKGKEVDENSTFEHFNGNKNSFGFENPKSSSSEEPENSKVYHAKKTNGLEKCLEAISNQSNFQEVGWSDHTR